MVWRKNRCSEHGREKEARTTQAEVGGLCVKRDLGRVL